MQAKIYTILDSFLMLWRKIKKARVPGRERRSYDFK